MKVAVRLTATEFVVEGGTAITTWWVYDDGHWTSARDIPDAVLTPRDQGPGVVWETTAELRVKPGTWVMRVRKRPRPQERTDPIRYLERGKLRAQGRIERRYFMINRRGQLRSPPNGLTPPLDPEDELGF
jgi:hypothetical protein